MAGVVNLEIAGYADAVGNRLRELREDRARRLYGLPPDEPVRPRQAGLFTIAALAQRIGVGERTLRYWEMGTTSPTMRHRRALARELGVSIDDLGLDGPDPANHHGAIVEAEG
jgi:transcriptional regulator with XRE-family HTH domain